MEQDFLTLQSNIGLRIEQAREEAGLSLPQLARRIAVKPKTLENWESERNEARGNKLVMLAGVLQVPPDLASDRRYPAILEPGAADLRSREDRAKA